MFFFHLAPKGTKMALKFLKKKTTKLKSFLREYSISLYLSPCPFIINMFGIAFETDEYYVFAQEYALAGDLFDIIPPQVLHLIFHSGSTFSVSVLWVKEFCKSVKPIQHEPVPPIYKEIERFGIWNFNNRVNQK